MPNSPNSELKKAMEEQELDSTKIGKEYSLKKYLVGLVEREHKRTGKSESQVADEALLFYFEHKDNKKIERNRFMSLEQLADEMPCSKCGRVIPAFTWVKYNSLKGALCLECDAQTHGSKALAQEKVATLTAKATLAAIESETNEKAEKLECLNNKEKAHELLLECAKIINMVKDDHEKQLSLFKQVPQLSDPELIAKQREQIEAISRFLEALQSLVPLFTVLEAIADDRLIRLKRRKRNPSIEESI